MACFADINVSQGRVATYARCIGIFNTQLTANLPRNLPGKKLLNRIKFDRIMVTSLWPRFLAHPIYHWFFYYSSHPLYGDRGIMFLGCPSVYLVCCTAVAGFEITQ